MHDFHFSISKDKGSILTIYTSKYRNPVVATMEIFDLYSVTNFSYYISNICTKQFFINVELCQKCLEDLNM